MQFFFEKVNLYTLIIFVAKGNSRFNVVALYNVDQNTSLAILHYLAFYLFFKFLFMLFLFKYNINPTHC